MDVQVAEHVGGEPVGGGAYRIGSGVAAAERVGEKVPPEHGLDGPDERVERRRQERAGNDVEWQEPGLHSRSIA
jgi:hypothetical protein